MRCHEVQTQLTDYLFNDLSPEMANEIRDHLHSCNNCSEEAKALQQILRIAKESDAYEEPASAYWNAFDDRFEKRLEMENRRVISEDLDEDKTVMSAYKMLAIAASLLIVIIAGSLFTEIEKGKDSTSDDISALTPIEVLGVRTEKYFDDARKLLFNILYTETGEDSLIDITLEKEYAAQLLKESRFLQTSLPETKQPELVYLVNQLEYILLQIAHLESEENAPEVEIVQDGIRKNAILMKINLHKINQLLEENRKKQDQKTKQKSKI